MNYTDLNESQKAQLMDVAVKFIVSTVDGFCANEVDANKQEYATRLLLHLKSHVELQHQEIETLKSEKVAYVNEWDILKRENERLDKALGIENELHIKADKEADRLDIENRNLKKEIERLKTIEQAYEALKLAKS